jgi:ADP-L-glycero-D-manno-heptose-6-epimerase
MSRKRKKRILVTGAAGFIGSALIHALNQRGVENILAVDVLGSDGKWRNLSPLKFDDYLQAEELLTTVEFDSLGDVDTVFHLGACSSTTETDGDYLIRNNYRFTQTLAEWALDHGARFVYASSAATYGDGSRGMDDRDEDLAKFRPLNLYGYSKHLFDLHAQRRGYLDDIVGIKYFNVFGPNEWHKGDMRSLVCKAYEQIVETGTIRLFKSYRPEYADGEQMRDFVYVKDAVDMTLHLAKSKKAGGLYNVGSGVARTWVDLGRAIFAALGREPSIEFVEMPESIRGQYQYYTCADISKLRDTGYHAPTTSLEDAVRDYVVNYLQPHAHLGDES